MIENSNLKLENADILNSGDGLNWYAYANNNPLKFVDPTGLSAWDDFVGKNINWGFFTTGHYSRTGGVDLNLCIFSMSAGKDGLQLEYLNIMGMESFGIALTWGGPMEEQGINLNYSNLTTYINIGIDWGSYYANVDVLGFGINASLGANTGVGAYWLLGEAYIGTDYTLAYSAISGGTYWDRAGNQTTIDKCWNNNTKVIRFGGKYIGPHWTADGWGEDYYDYAINDWSDWPVAYSMMDHSARIHDDFKNWGSSEISDAADMALRNNSIKAFFFSPHASDKIRALGSILYFGNMTSRFTGITPLGVWVEETLGDIF